MNNQKYYLTLEQKAQKKARLEEIQTIDIPKNAEEIEYAKSQGDLSENAEYDAAKEQHAKLLKEIADLENQLNNAIIITENASNEQVEIGHSVTIEWADGKVETVKILGYGDGKKDISYDAPLGNALLKHRVNDMISYEAPIGRLNLKILAIE